MIASDGHSLADEPSTRQARVRRVELPHGGDLRDRHVVERAESGEDDPAEQNRLELDVGQLAGQDARVVGKGARKVGRPDGPPRHARRDDQSREGADDGRRRSNRNPVGQVDRGEHHRRGADQYDEHRMPADRQRRHHERPDDGEGHTEAREGHGAFPPRHRQNHCDVHGQQPQHLMGADEIGENVGRAAFEGGGIEDRPNLVADVEPVGNDLRRDVDGHVHAVDLHLHGRLARGIDFADRRDLARHGLRAVGVQGPRADGRLPFRPQGHEQNGCGYSQRQDDGGQNRRNAPASPRGDVQGARMRMAVARQHPTSLPARHPSTSEIGMRTCSIVSRSRMVTERSSRESKSTVMQKGVPISSWRR